MAKSSQKVPRRRVKSEETDEMGTPIDLLKVVVIGESGAGKSNLIQRLVVDRFDDRSKSTIGIDFALFEFQLPSCGGGGKKRQSMTPYKAQIWDTAGQERYRSSMTKIFYRDVAGALLVFDLTNRLHYTELTRWLREIRTNVHHIDGASGHEVMDQIPIVLVGNKVDQANQYRATDPNEGLAFVGQNHLADYVETSAKTGYNVRQAFMTLFEHILLPVGNAPPARRKERIHREPSIKLSQDKHYLAQRKKHSKHSTTTNNNHHHHPPKRQSKDKCSC